MYAKGADVDALREAAHRMTHFGNDVDEIRSTANRAVRAMQRVWSGPDLQPVVERWRRVEHELHVISKNFDRTSRRLHHNADAQRRSSGLPTGGHGSTGFTPAPAHHPSASTGHSAHAHTVHGAAIEVPVPHAAGGGFQILPFPHELSGGGLHILPWLSDTTRPPQAELVAATSHWLGTGSWHDPGTPHGIR